MAAYTGPVAPASGAFGVWARRTKLVPNTKRRRLPRPSVAADDSPRDRPGTLSRRCSAALKAITSLRGNLVPRLVQSMRVIVREQTRFPRGQSPRSSLRTPALRGERGPLRPRRGTDGRVGPGPLAHRHGGRRRAPRRKGARRRGLTRRGVHTQTVGVAHLCRRVQAGPGLRLAIASER